MKQLLLSRKAILTFSLFIILNIQLKAGHSIYDSLNEADSTDIQEQLNAYFDDMNSALIMILQLSKKINTPVLSKNESYLVLSEDSCALYQSINPNIEALNRPTDNKQKFLQIDETINMVRLQHEDYNFWVDKSCTRTTIGNQIQGYLQAYIAGSSTYDMIENIKSIQDENYEDYLAFIEPEEIASNKTNKAIIDKIENKKFIFEKIYSRLIKQLDSSEINAVPMKDRLSLNAQLQFGSSDFNSNFFSGAPLSNSSGSTDVGVNARYRIDQNSSADFFINNRAETRITSFNTLSTGGSYSTKLGSNLVNAGVHYQSYKDKGIATNDNRRTKLFASLANRSRKNLSYGFRYNFINQKYTQLTASNYQRHILNGRATFKRSATKNIVAELNLTNGNSELALFKYNLINPRVTFNTRAKNSKTALTLSMDRTNFSDDAISDNTRYYINYKKNMRADGQLNKGNDFGLVYRSYASEPTNDYLDGYIKFSSSRYSENKMRNYTLFRFRYLPDLKESSHADFRIYREKGESKFYSIDNNLRLLYPTDEQIITKLSGYYKMGWGSRALRIGPIFRWHIVHDFKADEQELLKYDQNSYMYGLEASGNYSPIEKLQVLYRVSYDMNTIYSLSNPTDNTFDTRNPTNFQLDLDVSYAVNHSMEVYGSVYTFRHNTDYTDTGITNLIESNNSTNFQIGMRLRNN